ncbi:MAG: hypothetical protein ACRDGN_14980 [bacterium]
MRSLRAISIVLAAMVLLTTGAPSATWADSDDKTRVRGVVVALNPDGSFQVQEYGQNSPRWQIILQRGAMIDDDDDDDRRFRHLRVGDIVEVKGRKLGGRTLLVKKVKLLAHSSSPVAAASAPQVQGQPPAAANPQNTVMAIIKTLGVGAAVKLFAQPLNSFINGLLQNRGAAVQAQTKVVPILSVTIGINAPGSAYVGAAQVSGPAAAMAKVEAVAVIEADYQQAFRVKVLVPVDNLKPWEAFRRVPGVGVSAIIDLRI